MESVPSYVESQLLVLDALCVQIKVATAQVEKLAKADPVCSRLMTTPGIGPITVVRFVSALDRIDRFPSAHFVESYIGLVPGEKSSSDVQQRLSITKAGSPALRWALVEAAWSLRLCCRSADGRPLQLWALEVEKRRGKRIATVALARKLAGILYALWRDGTTYDSRRAAAQ
jgi:transposase